MLYRISCLAGETADLLHLPEDLRPALLASASASPAGGAAGTVNLSSVSALSDAKRAASDEVERAFLERGLQEVGGTVAELARRWEMNRSHLQILLKKHGIHSKDFRNPSPSNGDKGA